MKKLLYYTLLYDTYSSLLTCKQQSYFEDYYFKNMSLSELATKYNVTRNAVHNHLKDTINKLEFYEENLHLSKKNQELALLLELIENEDIKKKLQEIIDL